ncbi:MAG TPA: BamA/TamA family outer membrane protein [Flavihumibacter sp.]|jgi:outer membrane protein insertion porin family
MPAYTTKLTIRNLWVLVCCSWLLILAPGCKVIKDYPSPQPFVYKTTIKLDAKLPSSQKAELADQIWNQLSDSLQVRYRKKSFLRKQIERPAVFDTSYAVESVKYINDLLRANGYMYGNIRWDSSLQTVEDQRRVTVNFRVEPGKVLRFDSIAFEFRDSILQQLALKHRRESRIKKGESFSNEKISAELDRLLNIFRDNGFLKITREDVYAQVDTVVAALIDPGLDPFEQIRLLEEMQKRRENPQIDVVFKQRGTENPVRLQQYRFRYIRFHPDLSLVSDNERREKDTITRRNISVIRSRNLTRPGFLARNNQMIPDSLYRQSDVYRTNNTFQQMSAWQQVGIDLNPVDSLAVVDADINMYLAKKQNISVDVEASRNATDLITTTNLFGMALNFGLQDRNLSKQSVLASTNFRFGIELGNQGRIIQTFQTSITQSFTIPKFVTPFKIKQERKLSNTRTLLSANGSITNLRDFLKVQSLNSAIGYEWTNQKNRNWYYSPLNIEYVRLFKTDSFYKQAAIIPNLENFYNDGLIISQYLIARTAWTRTNKVYNIKIQIEESGGIFGNFRQFDLTNRLFRFAKADVDFRHYINKGYSSWAFRFFAGLGIPYGKQYDSTGKIVREPNLPFFKSYFAGGPSSMRAWQVRQLGPGSSTYFQGANTFRFADVQLESNIEYRFPLGNLFGINLKSAFFTDIGNIWYRNNQGNPALDEGVFRLKHLYRDIAVAGGTSLRLDFNYFMIRFDWAYKLKDPLYADQKNGWFQNVNLLRGQFQLGINAPF